MSQLWRVGCRGNFDGDARIEEKKKNQQRAREDGRSVPSVAPMGPYGEIYGHAVTMI